MAPLSNSDPKGVDASARQILAAVLKSLDEQDIAGAHQRLTGAFADGAVRKQLKKLLAAPDGSKSGLGGGTATEEIAGPAATKLLSDFLDSAEEDEAPALPVENNNFPFDDSPSIARSRTAGDVASSAAVVPSSPTHSTARTPSGDFSATPSALHRLGVARETHDAHPQPIRKPTQDVPSLSAHGGVIEAGAGVMTAIGAGQPLPARTITPKTNTTSTQLQGLVMTAGAQRPPEPTADVPTLEKLGEDAYRLLKSFVDEPKPKVAATAMAGAGINRRPSDPSGAGVIVQKKGPRR